MSQSRQKRHARLILVARVRDTLLVSVLALSLHSKKKIQKNKEIKKKVGSWKLTKKTSFASS